MLSKTLSSSSSTCLSLYVIVVKSFPAISQPLSTSFLRQADHMTSVADVEMTFPAIPASVSLFLTSLLGLSE